MARIPVEPAPKRTPWWAWLLGLILLGALALFLLDRLDIGDGRPNDLQRADTTPPTDLVITDVAALAGASPESDMVGREVNVPNAIIAEVLSDSLLFINVAGAGVAANDNVPAESEGAGEQGQAAVGGATGVAVFGDRLLVMLERPAGGAGAEARATGLHPSQEVMVRGRVERVEGSRVSSLNLSEEQREQVERSGVYIRAEHIGATPEAGEQTDTTRT